MTAGRLSALTLVLVCCLVLVAEPASAAQDNKGTEFMLTFMENYFGEPALTLYITGDTAATGTVDIPDLEFSSPFTVTPGAVTAVSLPSSAFVTGSDVITQRGIGVTATAEIAVLGLSHISNTTDAFLGLPVNILGTDYVVLGWKQNSAASELAIAAVEDDTQVTITPSISTGTRVAGVPYTITMNRFDAYQLKSDNAAEDLSGSTITSDKPIAVFGGARCEDVPDTAGACDHLVEHLPPT